MKLLNEATEELYAGAAAPGTSDTFGSSPQPPRLARRLAFAAALALLALAVWLLPAQAQADVLVSNMAQRTSPDTPDEVSSGDTSAQGFETGPTALGYSLTSIELDIDDSTILSADLTVSLRAKSSEGDYPSPIDLVTFVNPSLAGAGTKEWTLPTGTSSYGLTPNTQYFVVIKASPGSGFIELNYTENTGEDSGGAGGWEVLDEVVSFEGGAWVLLGSYSFHIRVNGTTATEAVLSPLPR